MNNIFFLKPYLNRKVWGGTHLKQFNIALNGAKDIGEAWIISGYPEKSSIITNGKFKNKTLEEVFIKHKKLFDNYEYDKYPLLVKLLDCNDDLSVQVHPGDKYALKHYDELGKNECWYVLKTKKNASIVNGHNAKTKKQLEEFIKNKNWKKLLRIKKIKEHDVIFIPAGCVHAINSGVVLYEIQQSSDLTFRVYDYDRNIKSRPLHIKESLKSITVPFKEPKLTNNKNILIENKYFHLIRIQNKSHKKYEFKNARWIQATVIDGKGKLDNKYNLIKGASFILTSEVKQFTLDGNLTLLISFICKQ